MSLAITIHIMSALIWVGGMFFAYMALRPAAASLLDPPLLLALWSQTLSRFFMWVWAAIILLPATGFWMVFNVFGGIGSSGRHIHIMLVVGSLMILLFMHLYFAPYRRLKLALADNQLEEAGRRLKQIRRLIAINLNLGIIVVIVASSGEYWV
ncbi:MAG: hypothetical protein GXP19_01825 [Gammaproteobacteria bacterium]|nr:hypothetical protein [Gammaproteobacteria bacterium]